MSDLSQPTSPQPPSKKKPDVAKVILISFGSLIALFVLLGACGAILGSEPTATPTVAAGPVERSEIGSSSDGVTEEPTIEESIEEEPTEEPEPEPTLTRAQEQAIGTAEDYLDSGHFSKKGLIEQLEYEGHSTKNATFAVNYIKPNWNEQAAGAAEDYLDSSHFSRSGLIDQLEYEGFTHSQAVYGAEKAGL